MIEDLKKRKEIGPTAYPCSVAGFLCEIGYLVRIAQSKWGDSWNSKHFLAEAESLKMLVEDMETCVKQAIEADSQDQVTHQK